MTEKYVLAKPIDIARGGVVELRTNTVTLHGSEFVPLEDKKQQIREQVMNVFEWGLKLGKQPSFLFTVNPEKVVDDAFVALVSLIYGEQK